MPVRAVSPRSAHNTTNASLYVSNDIGPFTFASADPSCSVPSEFSAQRSGVLLWSLRRTLGFIRLFSGSPAGHLI